MGSSARCCASLTPRQVTLGVVDSERGTEEHPRGNFGLYRSCHKIQLLLWASTNSFRYMRSTLDQEVEWATASERELLINEMLLFTKEVRLSTTAVAVVVSLFSLSLHMR
jgi:hypothetical protein